MEWRLRVEPPQAEAQHISTSGGFKGVAGVVWLLNKSSGPQIVQDFKAKLATLPKLDSITQKTVFLFWKLQKPVFEGNVTFTG